MFKCLKPKISIIWLKTLNGCDNMTSAQRPIWLRAKKADLNLAVDDVCTDDSNHTSVIVRFWDQLRLITPV